jgi:hypothetical protein
VLSGLHPIFFHLSKGYAVLATKEAFMSAKAGFIRGKRAERELIERLRLLFVRGTDTGSDTVEGFQIKYSSLQFRNEYSTPRQNRLWPNAHWAWQNIRGKGGKARYKYLILMGGPPCNPKYVDKYKAYFDTRPTPFLLTTASYYFLFSSSEISQSILAEKNTVIVTFPKAGLEDHRRVWGVSKYVLPRLSAFESLEARVRELVMSDPVDEFDSAKAAAEREYFEQIRLAWDRIKKEFGRLDFADKLRKLNQADAALQAKWAERERGLDFQLGAISRERSLIGSLHAAVVGQGKARSDMNM